VRGERRKASWDAGSRAVKVSPMFPAIPLVSPQISRQDSRHFSEGAR